MKIAVTLTDLPYAQSRHIGRNDGSDQLQPWGSLAVQASPATNITSSAPICEQFLYWQPESPQPIQCPQAACQLPLESAWPSLRNCRQDMLLPNHSVCFSHCIQFGIQPHWTATNLLALLELLCNELVCMHCCRLATHHCIYRPNPRRPVARVVAIHCCSC